MAATKTKIVATLGPASDRRDVLERMLTAGVDVVRFNMSHGTQQEHQQVLDTLRQILAGRDQHVATMADLAGPKVRTGTISSQEADLSEGQTCTIVQGAEIGTAHKFSINYPEVIDEVQAGHRVLIDDGSIRLRVVEKSGASLQCTCEIGGTIGSHKGVNLPDTQLSLPCLGEKDHADLLWAAGNRFDYVAISFVRSAADIQVVRDTLREAGVDIPIVAKIETLHAIKKLNEVVDAADVVLVARGDLGVEMDVWRVPMLQKQIVRRCRIVGKPAIVATQMLQSMIEQPVPTRAEVSDVANAVFDGADAVMLSGESAVGKYPVDAVAMLNRVAEQAERDQAEVETSTRRLSDEALFVGHDVDRRSAAVARSAVVIAEDIGAKVVAVWCGTGRIARWISKYQPRQTEVALCTDEGMSRRMALSYGVEPMLVVQESARGAAYWLDVQARIAKHCSLEPGDAVVVVGDPVNPHRMSTLSIEIIPPLSG